MKKVLLIVLIGILLTGCSQESVDPILDMGIEMAAADYSMDRLQITGDQYADRTEGLLSDSDRYYNREVMGFEGKMYTVKDLMGMTSEETEALREAWIESFEELGLSEMGSLDDFSVSRVYDDPNLSFKYLFTRADITIFNQKGYDYRKYTLHEDDGQWKILVSKQFITYGDPPRNPVDLERFLQVGGEPIEFVQKISLND